MTVEKNTNSATYTAQPSEAVVNAVSQDDFSVQYLVEKHQIATKAAGKQAQLEQAGVVAQLAQAPEAVQTAFLNRIIEQNIQRDDHAKLHALAKETVEQHAALEKLAATGQAVEIEVKQALDRGETIEQVQQKAKSADTVTKAATASIAQEYTQEKQQQAAKQADEAHRDKVGLTAQEPEHPLAATLAKHAGAAESLVAALGGHEQDHGQAATSQAVVKAAQTSPDTGRGSRT